MKSITVFFQREALRGLSDLEVGPGVTLAAVKGQLIEKGLATSETLLFLEDHDDPVDLAAKVESLAGKAGVKLHLHRCKLIEAAVTFGRDVVKRSFGPGATVGAVKRWAARELKMSDADASEHVLQLKGSDDRPEVGTHIGTLAECPKCRVDFDLVPNERIQG